MEAESGVVESLPERTSSANCRSLGSTRRGCVVSATHETTYMEATIKQLTSMLVVIGSKEGTTGKWHSAGGYKRISIPVMRRPYRYVLNS